MQHSYKNAKTVMCGLHKNSQSIRITGYSGTKAGITHECCYKNILYFRKLHNEAEHLHVKTPLCVNNERNFLVDILHEILG